MTHIDRELAQIARHHLHIGTLEARHSDGLDFHEVSAWGVKAALHAANDLGRKVSRKTTGGAA
jgi:hypothetical protein